jgi:hypothetical protein
VAQFEKAALVAKLRHARDPVFPTGWRGRSASLNVHWGKVKPFSQTCSNPLCSAAVCQPWLY